MFIPTDWPWGPDRRAGEGLEATPGLRGGMVSGAAGMGVAARHLSSLTSQEIA